MMITSVFSSDALRRERRCSNGVSERLRLPSTTVLFSSSLDISIVPSLSLPDSVKSSVTRLECEAAADDGARFVGRSHGGLLIHDGVAEELARGLVGLDSARAGRVSEMREASCRATVSIRSGMVEHSAL